MSHHHIQIFHLRTEQACWKCPIRLSTILESFTNSSILFCYPQRHLQWSTMPTMSTIPGCILSRCEEDVIQHMDLFLVPRLQNFYEGREASTREDHLPRGKRRMNEMVCPICCRALTTEHCLRLDYCIHWRLSYYSQRGDTLQAALLTIELLSTTRFETQNPSLSLYMSTATFHRGLKALCSILVSRPKKHSIENLRTKPPLQPPHFTQLKFSHLCLVPQCAILWYPKAPVTIQLWQTPHQASGCKGPSDIQVIMGMGGGWQGC